MSEEPVAPRSKNRILTLIGVLIGFAAMVLLVVFWAWPPYKSTKAFDEPKLTTVHLDEEPFMRLALRQGETYRPIDVMEGTVVAFNCEVVVKASGKPRFVLQAFGQTREGNDCTFQIPVPTSPGLIDNLVVTFYDGGAAVATDSLSVPVMIVPRFTGIQFQALEDSKHLIVDAGSAPEAVYLYARAIAKLPGDGRDFAALFFTADPSNGVPVLEMMPLKEGEAPEAMVGSVIRFRSYGADLAGYAFWSPEPIRTAGRDGNRSVTDLYVGIFRREAVASIFRKVLKVDVTGPDTVTVTPLIRNATELAALTVDGRLLSQSLHVVRGPTTAAGNEARVPAEAGR